MTTHWLVLGCCASFLAGCVLAWWARVLPLKRELADVKRLLAGTAAELAALTNRRAANQTRRW